MEWDGNPDNYNEACQEILRATRDGEDLAPTDLKLVERVVNASSTGVSEALELAFDDLYRRVKRGYVKPWFHGIEHLTIDHEGYVYWKGAHVEHYTLSWAFSAEAKKEAGELARRCRIVEARGERVRTWSVIWAWQDTPGVIS